MTNLLAYLLLDDIYLGLQNGCPRRKRQAAGQIRLPATNDQQRDPHVTQELNPRDIARLRRA